MKRVAVLLAALLLGAAAPVDPTHNARVFDRAWNLVEDRYWDEARLGARWEAARDRYRPQALAAPDESRLYRVLDAMLAEVGDSHVFAVDPVQERFDANRGKGGEGEFGFSTEQVAGAWRVFAVDRAGPAAEAGVEIGWRLAAVNERPVDPDYHPRPGERATLAFEDETGAMHRLTLTGAVLPEPAARAATPLPDGVLLVRLDAFERGADDWLRGEIDEARPRAVILDLRENYGGEAIAVARVAGSLFAEKHVLLRRQGRGKAIDVPVLRWGARAWTGPLAVLVGPRSASGAEVVAALVDESGRGMTLGERTAGALTGASLYDLPGGGKLSVAVFDIRTPGGRRLEGRGFTPRIVVVPTLAELRGGRDPVLARAVAALRGETASESSLAPAQAGVPLP